MGKHATMHHVGARQSVEYKIMQNPVIPIAPAFLSLLSHYLLVGGGERETKVRPRWGELESGAMAGCLIFRMAHGSLRGELHRGRYWPVGSMAEIKQIKYHAATYIHI